VQNAVSYATLASEANLPLSNGTKYYLAGKSAQGGGFRWFLYLLYIILQTSPVLNNGVWPHHHNGGTVYSSPVTFNWEPGNPDIRNAVYRSVINMQLLLPRMQKMKLSGAD